MPSTLGLLLLALLILTPWPVLAGEEPPPSRRELKKNQQELAKVLATLKEEQKALDKSKGEEKTILGELEGLDRKLEEVGQKKEKLSGQANTLRKEINRNEKRAEQHQAELKKAQKRLGAHIRLIYGMGEQGIVKVALSQETPGRMQQGMKYFGYFVDARQQQFAELRQHMAALATANQEKEQAMAQVKGVEKALSGQEEADRQQRLTRAELLAKVRQEAGLHEKKVAELTAVQKELTSFIERLEQSLKQASLDQPQRPTDEPRREVKPVVQTRSTKPMDDTNMRVNRGRLPPPVEGKWRGKEPGLFFDVGQAQVVGAIYRGQVVFADWFKGYGLLVILNHGDHLFSLYGHNQKLLVAQGDWVESGERIAESGDTGSLDGPGLYFEIRQEGRAVEPERWLALGG